MNNQALNVSRSCVRSACRLTLGMVLIGLMAGCGGGKPPSGAGAPPKPDAEAAAQAQERKKLQALEASGAIPALERTPTLGGIDANGDGVRDDIALHIQKTYADPAQRKAAMQTARALQQTLLVNKNDAVALEEAAMQQARAVNCVSRLYPSIEEFSKGVAMSGELEGMTTNTKIRLESYLSYSKALSGTVLPRAEGNTCD